MLRKLIGGMFLLGCLLGISQVFRTASPTTVAASVTVSRAQFAEYIDALSEPEGYFDTDNFISNETSYLHVIPELRRSVQPGNVYLGVGPDQNFSYIVHTQPSLAIITDIRRQNLLQHLLYKALFDLSGTRAEYLSLWVSRETPKVDPNSALPSILEAIRKAPTSETRYSNNLASIRRKLQDYGVKLSAEDLQKIEYVYRTFHEEGVDLRFSSIGRNNASNYPTLESLLLQTDGAGALQGYLSTEALFRRMKTFQAENRLIPVVGDFAGPKALKAVATFLKKNSLQVSSFYTSNVEYYLFGNEQWKPYVDNVRTLPVTSDAVFIRAYFGSDGRHPQNIAGHRATSLVQSLPQFLKDQSEGRIRSYGDIVLR